LKYFLAWKLTGTAIFVPVSWFWMTAPALVVKPKCSAFECFTKIAYALGSLNKESTQQGRPL